MGSFQFPYIFHKIYLQVAASRKFARPLLNLFEVEIVKPTMPGSWLLTAAVQKKNLKSYHIMCREIEDPEVHNHLKSF